HGGRVGRTATATLLRGHECRQREGVRPADVGMLAGVGRVLLPEVTARLSRCSSLVAYSGAFDPAETKEPVSFAEQWSHGIPGQPRGALGNRRWRREGGREQHLRAEHMVDDRHQMLAESERAPEKIWA